MDLLLSLHRLVHEERQVRCPGVTGINDHIGKIETV